MARRFHFGTVAWLAALLPLVASHMAQSAAAMKAGPFTVPPGRSSAARNGMAMVHWWSSTDSRRMP